MKCKALKIAWVKRLLECEENVRWAALVWYQLPKNSQHILKGNLNPRDMSNMKNNCKSQFWREVLIYWSEFKYQEPINKNAILDQPLWYNSFIRSGNKPLWIKECQDVGINKISDITNESGQLITFRQAINKFPANIHFLNWLIIIHAIPARWKTTLGDMENNLRTHDRLTQILRHEKTSQYAYSILVQPIRASPTIHIKWSEELSLNVDQDMIKNAFSKIYTSTISSRIRYFQFRLTHRILGNNSKLFKWGMVESNKCDLCKKEVETYIHLFVKCEKYKIFGQILEIG